MNVFSDTRVMLHRCGNSRQLCDTVYAGRNLGIGRHAVAVTYLVILWRLFYG